MGRVGVRSSVRGVLIGGLQDNVNAVVAAAPVTAACFAATYSAAGAPTVPLLRAANNIEIMQLGKYFIFLIPINCSDNSFLM